MLARRYVYQSRMYIKTIIIVEIKGVHFYTRQIFKHPLTVNEGLLWESWTA